MAQTINLGKVIGPQGPAGQAGPKGDTGAKGGDGSTWLSGAIAPTTQGKDGDFYINTATFDVYKKASGAWSKTGNIKGAAGATGPQGAPGQQGPKGEAGATGPQGTAGPKGDKGEAGATPTFSVNANGELIATYA